MAKLSCYNRGCGQDFDPEKNPDGEWNYFSKKNGLEKWIFGENFGPRKFVAIEIFKLFDANA